MKLIPLLFLFLFAAGCQSERMKPKVDPYLKVEELPDQESHHSRVFFSDSGKTTAVLTAGRIKVFYNKQLTLIDSNMQIDFYNPAQIITSKLTSEKGRVNDLTKDLFAINNVIAENDSGVVLKTEELMWRNSDRKIISDKFVTITSPSEKIEGYGFESDQGLNNYTIFNITYVTRLDTI
jgi:LPS export ABC transporter protein LptC